MTLVPVSQLLASARNDHYALGYFESWNLESLQGVIDAAEQTSSPVIIGFNGEFLTSPQRLTRERIEWYGALGKTAAETARVPCAFIFNECPLEEPVRKAVQSGFNLVMLSSGERSFDEYLRRTASLVEFAHAHQVAVEAELGELPSGETGTVESGHSSLTDPQQAAWFVSETQVDVLSVSAGNVHVLLDGKQDLDLDHLERISRQVAVPLGLHGGTGISNASLRAAILLGVAKVNYGTILKNNYLAGLRRALSSSETNPHRLLGIGGDQDVLVAGRRAVCEAVLERIDILGCSGRA